MFAIYTRAGYMNGDFPIDHAETAEKAIIKVNQLIEASDYTTRPDDYFITNDQNPDDDIDPSDLWGASDPRNLF